MTVGAVRPERKDDVRTEAPEMVHDAPDHFARIHTVELLVAVVEQRDLFDPESGSRVLQLSFPDPGERRRSGVPRIVASQAAVAAAFAPRGRHEEHVRSPGCVCGQRTAHTERLVVGMGEHGKQFS